MTIEDAYIISRKRLIRGAPRLSDDAYFIDDEDSDDLESESYPISLQRQRLTRRGSSSRLARARDIESKIDEDASEAILERATFGGFGFASFGMVLLIVGVMAMVATYYGSGYGSGFGGGSGGFAGPPQTASFVGDSDYESGAIYTASSSGFGGSLSFARQSMVFMMGAFMVINGAILLAIDRMRAFVGGR
jgi:hypothetical protein